MISNVLAYHAKETRRGLIGTRLLGSTALLATLAACGGGGGGASTSGTPSMFQTAEFERSTGLDQIRASQGYARITGRQGGAGVRVAVIDDGMALHPDYEIVAEAQFDDDVGLRDSPHGTAVGGIIAARKNGVGTHGVAFNADLINIQVFDDQNSLPNERLTVAINAAAGLLPDFPTLEADVMNLSLGGGPFVPEHLAAMQAAAGEGKIMVFAAGNDATPEPVFPGAAATDPGVGGLGIVVGSVDSNNNLSDFSAQCGAAQDVCLVAPGENITTTGVGGGLVSFTGTSAATPFVSGAAAVVKAAFPGVSSAAVVGRLFDSATDLGAPGVDATFGHGLLNLDRALAPSGSLGVATSTSVDGPRVGVQGSRLTLGSAVTLQGAGEALLEEVVALDEDGFPFGVDLGNDHHETSRATGMESFVAGRDRLTSIATTPQGSVALAISPDELPLDPHQAAFSSETDFRPEAEGPQMQFRSTPTDGVDLFFALNGSSVTEVGLTATLAREGGDALAPSAFLAPYDQLAGAQSGGGAAIALGSDTTLTLSAFDAADDELEQQAAMQKVEISHRTLGALELRVGWGVMEEEGGFLGSQTEGAFGSDTASQSQYFDLSLLAPVTDQISLFGAYTRGRSDPDSGTASLLGDYSTLHAEAFGVGLIMRDVAREGDGLTMMFGQPLRVIDGSATVTVPVGRTEDGQVLSESAEVDLAPDGREFAAEAVYRFALDDRNQSLATGAFVRFNPDHDPEASPDLGLGVRYQLTF